MTRSLILFLSTCLISLLTHVALGGNGGSGYSRYGIGDIRFFAGGRSAGMGGTTVALIGLNSINRLNPAGQTEISRTHLSGTFSYEGFKTTDGVRSSYLSSGNFGGAIFAVPISPSDGLTFSAGFNPYSSVNYKVQDDQAFGSDLYSQVYFGEGGLSTALAGLSFTPFDSLHLGLRMNYLFGQIRSGSDVSSSSSDFAATKYRRTVSANGFDFTFGAIYNGFGRLTGATGLNNLNVGVILSTATNLNATQENINISPIGEDTLAVRDGEIHIPISGGAGIAWLLNDKYLLAADFLHQKWSDFSFYGVHPPQIRSSSRVSLGIEIQPSRETGASYWKKVAYRFGAYHLSSYYQIGSTSINEIAVTAGLGLPIAYDTNLDLAVEYGRRGTTGQHLLKDNILRLSFTLNAGERWFVRSEEE